MKRLRILLLAFFVVVAVIFAGYEGIHFLKSDTEPPVIHADSKSFSASVKASDKDLLKGVTATDNRDGDVSKTLMISAKSKFISTKTHTVRITYVAFDKSKNVGTLDRELTYTDYYSPHFTASQPLRFNTDSSKDTNYLSNISAVDCLDGRIGGQVRLEYLDNSAVGNGDANVTVPVRLTVSNSVGDTSTLDVNLRLQDSETYSLPAPALDDYIIYLKKGDHPDFSNLITGYWQGGTYTKFSEDSLYQKSDCTFDDSQVDYNTPGTYEVPFTLKAGAANAALPGENGAAATGTNYAVVVVGE